MTTTRTVRLTLLGSDATLTCDASPEVLRYTTQPGLIVVTTVNAVDDNPSLDFSLTQGPDGSGGDPNSMYIPLIM